MIFCDATCHDTNHTRKEVFSKMDVDADAVRLGRLLLVGAVVGGCISALSFCYFGYCLLKGKMSRQPRPRPQ